MIPGSLWRSCCSPATTPPTRPRIVVGSPPAHGRACWASGTPRPARHRPARGGRPAAGAIGYVAGAPLVSGLTSWVAVPVLVLVTGYVLLVLTATPVRQLPRRLRRMWLRLTGRPLPPELSDVTEAAADARRCGRHGARNRGRARDRRAPPPGAPPPGRRWPTTTGQPSRGCGAVPVPAAPALRPVPTAGAGRIAIREPAHRQGTR